MNWDAAGAVGEILGAIAVVLTLIYLSKQIKLSREATIASTHHAITHNLTQAIAANGSDPEWLKIVDKLADVGWSGLEQHEQTRHAIYLANLTSVMEDTFYQWQKGLVSDSTWRGRETLFLDNLKTMGFNYLASRRDWYDRDFVDYMLKRYETHEVKARPVRYNQT